LKKRDLERCSDEKKDYGEKNSLVFLFIDVFCQTERRSESRDALSGREHKTETRRRGEQNKKIVLVLRRTISSSCP
jgi:hypothetical protein